MSQPIALYLHIPFCETKCPYCDFNTYAGIEHLVPQYVDALARELRLWGQALASEHPAWSGGPLLSANASLSPFIPLPSREEGSIGPSTSRERGLIPASPIKGEGQQSVATIFFGGGTPSYLPPQHIQRLLDTARNYFQVLDTAEVSLESNPGDITPERLGAWRAAGVNRLSIGVQSLDDGLLQLLGRRHTASQAMGAYCAARDTGFANVNLDLMFGLPGQTLAQWRDTLEHTLALGPAHLSMYCLTLEEGTPLEAWVRTGKVPEPDPDLAADMYELAQRLAAEAGYRQYEISNWSLPGREARHNLAYWRSQPYLGVGPGAHSYLGGWRFAVIKSPARYVQRVEACAGLAPAGWTPIALKEQGLLDSAEAIETLTAMGETMMMGLRLAEGVSDVDFRQRFSAGLGQVYAQEIKELEELGLLQWEGDRLKLTPRGLLLGNEVFQRFLVQM